MDSEPKKAATDDASPLAGPSGSNPPTGPDAGSGVRGRGVRARAARLRARIRALPGGRTALKVVVAATGALFVAVGLLLVPLPGPGWAIVFGGLAIWAIEFAWAQNLLNWVRRRVRAWTARVRRLPWPARILLGTVILATLVAVAWLWIDQRYGSEALGRLWEYLRTH